jgi:hypothetical protein
MFKRIILAVVGGAMGAFAGLAIAYFGGGNAAILLGGIIGAIVPQFVLGPPAR